MLERGVIADAKVPDNRETPMKTQDQPIIESANASTSSYQTGLTPWEIADRYGFGIDDIIKLDANENPFGPPPHAALLLASNILANRYPDAEARELRNSLEDYTGVPASKIVVGSGSDELLHLVCLMTLHSGDEIITLEPTFSMYAIYAEQCGAQIIALPRDEHFDIVPETLLRAVGPRTKLIFLCSPNSPTGNALPDGLLKQVLALGKMVIVDEAYIEFGGETAIPLLQSWPNLLILRTFSKFFGLAGLRIGYGLFSQVTADAFWKIKSPYNVNLAAQGAALATLNEDLPWLYHRRDEILAGREWLYKMLGNLACFKPFPSLGNFLLIRIGKPLEVRLVIEGLARAGILVRSFSHPYLRDCIRLTVGTSDQNATVMKVLRQLDRDTTQSMKL